MSLKAKESALVAEVRAYCAAHADPKLAARYARYFAEGYDAWGLLSKDHPFFHAVKDEWIEKYRSLGLPGFLAAGAELCRSGKFEEASIAILFVKSRREQVDTAALTGLSRWFDGGIRNWAHVDVLCMEVLTPALRAGQYAMDDLALWRESPWKYQRRASVVALIPPAVGAGEVPALLRYISPLMQDPDKPVQQSLGWMLRECWKLTPKPVERFLREHVAAAPRQIYQIATEKMTADQKASFRRPPRVKA